MGKRKTIKVKSGTRSVDKSQSKAIRKNAEAIAELQAPVELKYLDRTFSQIALTASNPSISSRSYVNPPVWEPAAGATATAGNALRISAREGNQIIAKSLTFDGYVELPGVGVGVDIDATLAECNIRVMLVQYPSSAKEQLGAGPYDLSNILQNVTGAPGDTPYATSSFLKIDPVLKYRVLVDRTFHLQNTSQATITNGFNRPTYKPRANMKFHHKFTKAQQEMCWEQGQVSLGPVKNDVRLWVFIDAQDASAGDPIIAAARPYLTGTMRFRYNDL